jgi:hypothetical protein
MRFPVVIAGLFAAWAAAAADVPNGERGRLLYENHCVTCHTPNVHRRPNRIALNPAELRQIVNQWQAQERLDWSAQDVEDVVQFLRQTRYRF